MFQATLRGWKRLAAGLVLVPGVAGIGEARGQTRFAEQSRHQPTTEAKASTAAEAGKQLMRQAQAAAERKDYAQARTLAERARTLRLPAQAYDITPDQFLAQMERKAPPANAARASAPAQTSDPKELVRQGRAALESGNIELAQDLARQAEALKPSSAWGLFADTPRSLQKDVQRAQTALAETAARVPLQIAHVRLAGIWIRDQVPQVWRRAL